MSCAVIIPARYESTRFPGKPLALISGKPMIEWVIESALKSKLANQVIVATEDERIVKKVNEIILGLQAHRTTGLQNYKSSSPQVLKPLDVCMTSKDHQCGADRITEVVKKNKDIKYIVNFQGDEPLLPPDYIDKVIKPITSGKAQMASLIAPITSVEEFNDPNIVKAVIDNEGFALYFSRSPIPHDRDKTGNIIAYRHLGIYSYTREALLKFNLLPQSLLEQAEKLEQLRALENGIKIKLEIIPKAYPAVDRPEDIKLVEDVLKSSTSLK